MLEMRVLQFISRVRTCQDCCASCRANAAELLEGPESVSIERCGECGFPKLRDSVCPCERFVGQPSNPAATQHHLKAMA